MSNFRRWFVPRRYVLLHGSYQRPLPNPDDHAGRRILRSAIDRVRDDRPFQIFATVLLPDHWHLVMNLAPGDAEYCRSRPMKTTNGHHELCQAAVSETPGTSQRIVKRPVGRLLDGR